MSVLEHKETVYVLYHKKGIGNKSKITIIDWFYYDSDALEILDKLEMIYLSYYYNRKDIIKETSAYNNSFIIMDTENIDLNSGYGLEYKILLDKIKNNEIGDSDYDIFYVVPVKVVDYDEVWNIIMDINSIYEPFYPL